MARIYKTNVNNICEGIWLMDDESESSIYIPFSLCIVIADAITFSDRDVVGCTEYAGYIEIYYDHDCIQLSDGTEVVVIKKEDIKDLKNQLWDLI